jgi:hypothetical protein
MSDEIMQFLEENYKVLSKDLNGLQKARELSALVNDVYALNPSDEDYIRANIMDFLISKGEI